MDRTQNYSSQQQKVKIKFTDKCICTNQFCIDGKRKDTRYEKDRFI